MKRNQHLASILANTTPKENLVAAKAIPQPDTTNLSGHEAYSQDKWFTLLAMLNTLKLEPQFYRSESEIVNKLISLIDDCAKEDPYFTAQCIVYSRCVGEGMRTITQLASVLLAKYLSGTDWGKRFYTRWDKKNQRGGVIFRPDDMSEMLTYWTALHTNADGKTLALPNSMKKAFREALESYDTYSLLKYKAPLIDVINVVHPRPTKSNAFVQVDSMNVPTFSAIIKGLNVSADTWEVAQSDAGQQVAQAVREGKISEEEAKQVLTEAKAENWEGLLNEGKLGILAALRNLRNILGNAPKADTINKLCDLVSDKDLILKGKIMPYQIDLANEVLWAEMASQGAYTRTLSLALQQGYLAALPNLRELLSGNNLVILDCSGSMNSQKITDPTRKMHYNGTCLQKAALIASTICKATNADLIRFGNTAEYVNYDPNESVFSLGPKVVRSMGGTDLGKAWDCAARSNRKYTRVFILSDNECNRGSAYKAYTNYMEKVGNPYVYSIDLAAYGTNAITGDKVRFYYGFGYSMFTDIASSEFNPSYHIEKVRKISI